MEVFVLCCWVLSTLSKCALWVGGQFKTGYYSILGARDFQPSVLQWWPSNPIVRLIRKQCAAKATHQSSSTFSTKLHHIKRQPVMFSSCKKCSGWLSSSTSVPAPSKPARPHQNRWKGKGTCWSNNCLKLTSQTYCSAASNKEDKSREVSRSKRRLVQKQIVKKVQKFDEPRTKILNPSHRVFFLLRNHLESFMTYILDLVYIYWYSFKSKPAEQISWKKWTSS